MTGFQITAVGNVTRDPELRFTPSGKAVAKFSIAKNVRVKDDKGNWTDGTPEFFDVTVWEGLAENVAESVGKGTRVIVSGELKQETWTDKDNPELKRSRHVIVADEVGPSLRWATASIKKATKSEGGAKSKPAPDSDWDDGEEPF